MGEFCEFEIDFGQFDDLRAIVVHDECGEHEDVWFYQFDELKAENAKLRELVKDMWGCISHIGEYDVFYYDASEDGCGVDCTVNGENCCAVKLHDRMHELGIEVDA